jgi:hypothetical protein
MTDTRSPPAATAIESRPGLPPAVGTDTVIALQAMAIYLEALQRYKSHLAAHILPSPVRYQNDKKKLEGQYDRLSELEAVNVLALIWKESRCVNEPALLQAGLVRSFEAGVTRNALGNALEQSDCRSKTFNSSVKYIRRAARVVEAAMTFGLVELDGKAEDGCRANFKPLQATEKLDHLMISLGIDFATLIHALSQNKEITLCRSSNLET